MFISEQCLKCLSCMNLVCQGLRNDLKAALDKIDQQYLHEIVAGQEQTEEDTQNDLKVHEENTTIEELEVCTILCIAMNTCTLC